MSPRVPVRRWRGSATEFHARPIEPMATPEVWVFEVTRPALVLGSAQPLDTVDERAADDAGYELVRRRSGGGAVLLEPGNVVWFDVVVPAAQLREHGVGDDVAGAMRWFGRRAADALDLVGVTATVHEGEMRRTAWSSVICFDGLGPGELTIADAKLVGISARRSRTATRFQCALPTAWHPERLVALLARPRPVPADLRPVATLEASSAAAVPAALADRLTRP